MIDEYLCFVRGKKTRAFSHVAFRPGALVDPWDKLRDGTVDLLGALPSPLPGLEAPPAVADLMSAGRRLLLSLRVRESDAGVVHSHYRIKEEIQDGNGRTHTHVHTAESIQANLDGINLWHKLMHFHGRNPFWTRMFIRNVG